MEGVVEVAVAFNNNLNCEMPPGWQGATGQKKLKANDHHGDLGSRHGERKGRRSREKIGRL